MTAFSPAGYALIHAMEGCRLTAYPDMGGRLTIGWGHTGPEVTPGLAWTQAQADHQLDNDLTAPLLTVDRLVTVPLGANQLAALTSLAFNIGVGAFRNECSAWQAANADLSTVPEHIMRWNEVRSVSGLPIVSPGLVGRRTAEVALWSLPDDAPIPDFGAIRDAAVAAWRSGADAA